MFYDDLTSKLSNEFKNFKYKSGDIYKALSKVDGSIAGKDLHQAIEEHPKLIPYLRLMIHRAALIDSLNESKIFKIDGAVLDSLHNVKHGNIDYEHSIKLPFPEIFFEFENPVTFRFEDGKQTEFNGALLDRTLKQKERQNNFVIKNYGSEFTSDTSAIWPTSYNVRFFNRYTSFVEHNDAAKEGVADISFDINSLPNFEFSANGRQYNINHTSNKIEYTDVSHFVETGNKKVEDITGKIDIEAFSDIKKKIDLSINLINYINAQNVAIMKFERDSRSNQDIARINRKRERDGKSLVSRLKPYYMVEVKKSYVNKNNEESSTDEKNEDEECWKLNYRVWVRGHFRHYQNGLCIWIEPFIKGPADAPWKHDRYEVLYKNFKHLLNNPNI